MPSFTPPTENGPRFVDPKKPRDFLFARLTALKRGVDVYKLTDATYTEVLPSDRATISVWYHGGHKHVVTLAEATSLTNAGYGANVVRGDALLLEDGSLLLTEAGFPILLESA